MDAQKDRDLWRERYTNLHDVFVSLDIQDPDNFKSDYDQTKRDLQKIKK